MNRIDSFEKRKNFRNGLLAQIDEVYFSEEGASLLY